MDAACFVRSCVGCVACVAQGAEALFVCVVHVMAGSVPSVFGYCVGPPGQKNHVVPIREECFWHIMQKRKTVEGLIAKGAMLNVFPGELLRFECGCQHIDVKVLAMVKYMSFREMLENEGLMNCLPNCADVAITHAHQLPVG